MPEQGASTHHPQNTIIPANPVISAVFPMRIRSGALHSYQSDTLRLAINKVQENKITYYVADIRIKSIDTFRTRLRMANTGRAFMKSRHNGREQ
jgi:hypothetical protein